MPYQTIACSHCAEVVQKLDTARCIYKRTGAVYHYWCNMLEHIDHDPIMSIQIQVEDNGEVSYGEGWTDGAELDRIRAWARRI